MTTGPSLILATSNGTGMGHLARQLAVGLSAAPSARVTLFSLSMALPTATALGIYGEYCPGPDRDWIPEAEWPHYLAGRLEALAKEVAADVVVFDGVAPYRGITLAKRRLPDTAFVWFRRGMWQEGVNEGQLWKSHLFDQIIEPGDLASPADRGATSSRNDSLRVSPVSLVEVVDRPAREEAASELGIDPANKNLLLTLGSGRLGDVSSPGAIVIETMRRRADWHVSVATSAVARSRVETSQSQNVTELQGVFPLARYLNAFDAVITAAGYNAVHEYLPAGLPVLLVPNRLTRTDDQVGRARHLADAGLALAVADDSRSALETSTAELLDESTRHRLRDALEGVPQTMKTGGAHRTVEALAHLASAYESRPLTATERLARLRDDAKEALKRRLGPSGTNRVRALLGRPVLGSADRSKVSVDGEPSRPGVRRLVYTSRPSVEDLLGDAIVEHVMGGTSEGYRAARRLLVDRHYEVVSSS